MRTIEEQKAYQRRWYQKNKVAVLKRQKGINARGRARNRKYIHGLKDSTPCADCHLRYPYFVMDFDHLQGKVEAVGTLAATGCSMEVLLAEIAKCEIVCANCHRVRTHNRGRVAQPADAVASRATG